MKVGFYNCPPNQTMPCSICLEPCQGDIVSHELTHPFHRECVKPWVLVNKSCPTCRTDINPSSLMTLRDRITRYYDHDLTLALITGIAMGYILALAFSAEELRNRPLEMTVTNVFSTLAASSLVGIAAYKHDGGKQVLIPLFFSCFTATVLGKF